MQKRLLIVAAVLTCALSTQPVLAKSKSPLTFVQTLEQSGVPVSAAAKAMSLTTQNSFVAAVEAFGATPDLLNAFLGLWLPALTGEGVVAQKDIVAFNNRADLSLAQRTHVRAFTQLMQNSPALAIRAAATGSSATGSAASSGGAKLGAGAIGGIAAAAAAVVAVVAVLVFKSRNEKGDTPNPGPGTVSNPTPPVPTPVPTPPATVMTAERRAEARLRVEAVKKAVDKHAPVVSKAFANHLLAGSELTFGAEMVEALGGEPWVVGQVQQAQAHGKKLEIDLEVFKALTPAQQEFVLAVRAIDFEALAARVRKLHIDGYVVETPGTDADAEPTKELRPGLFAALQALFKNGVVQEDAFANDDAIDALAGVSDTDKAEAKAKRDRLVAGIAGLTDKRQARKDARDDFTKETSGLDAVVTVTVAKEFTDTNAVRNTAGDADLSIVTGDLPEGEADLKLIFNAINTEIAELAHLSGELDRVMNVLNPDGLLDGDLVNKGSRKKRAKRAQQGADVVPQIREAQDKLAARKAALDARKQEVARHSAPLLGRLWFEEDVKRTNNLKSVATLKDLMEYTFVVLTEGATLDARSGSTQDQQVKTRHEAFNAEFTKKACKLRKAQSDAVLNSIAGEETYADLETLSTNLPAVPEGLDACLKDVDGADVGITDKDEWTTAEQAAGIAAALKTAKQGKWRAEEVARYEKAFAEATADNIGAVTLTKRPEGLYGTDNFQDAFNAAKEARKAKLAEELTALKDRQEAYTAAAQAEITAVASMNAGELAGLNLTVPTEDVGDLDVAALETAFGAAVTARKAKLAEELTALKDRQEAYTAAAQAEITAVASMNAGELAGLNLTVPTEDVGDLDVAALETAFGAAVTARKAQLAEELKGRQEAYTAAAQAEIAAVASMNAGELAGLNLTVPTEDVGDLDVAALETAFGAAVTARKAKLAEELKGRQEAYTAAAQAEIAAVASMNAGELAGLNLTVPTEDVGDLDVAALETAFGAAVTARKAKLAEELKGRQEAYTAAAQAEIAAVASMNAGELAGLNLTVPTEDVGDLDVAALETAFGAAVTARKAKLAEELKGRQEAYTAAAQAEIAAVASMNAGELAGLNLTVPTEDVGDLDVAALETAFGAAVTARKAQLAEELKGRQEAYTAAAQAEIAAVASMNAGELAGLNLTVPTEDVGDLDVAALETAFGAAVVKRQAQLDSMVDLLNGKWADDDVEKLGNLFSGEDISEKDVEDLAATKDLWTPDVDNTLLGDLRYVKEARIPVASCKVGLEKVNAAIAEAEARLEKLKTAVVASPKFDEYGIALVEEYWTENRSETHDPNRLSKNIAKYVAQLAAAGHTEFLTESNEPHIAVGDLRAGGDGYEGGDHWRTDLTSFFNWMEKRSAVK